MKMSELLKSEVDRVRVHTRAGRARASVRTCVAYQDCLY